MIKYGMLVRKKNLSFDNKISFSFFLERFIILTCIAYTFRVLIHYIHASLARYVFLTKNELKQLGLVAPGNFFSV
jgi:hypothetical protein